MNSIILGIEAAGATLLSKLSGMLYGAPLLRRETPELPRFRLKVIPDEKLDFSAFFFFFFFFSRILRTTRVSEALYRKDCGEIRNIGNVRRFRSGTRKFDIVRRESRLRTGLLETIFFITVCTIS